jgi:exonuclease SbcC
VHFEQLTISGFGPYAGTEVIDFDALAQKGLFSVTGDTGSGKTTIFDALTFALYGDLPGMRPAGTVRSEHSGPRQKCEVELVFRAGGSKWRVVRIPKHERPKLRGAGLTEVKNHAALYRWDGTDWEPLTTTINDVTKQCVTLVGLAQDQFERVGLLPQGEFRRLLVANSSERKKLFRTLFGTASVEAAVRQLNDDAKAARADATAAQNRLEEVEAEAAPLLSTLVEVASAQTEGVFSLPSVEPTADGAQSAVTSLDEVAHDVQRRVLPMLEGAEAAAISASQNASKALGSATELATKVNRMSSLKAERSGLDAERPAIEKGAAAAEVARRAAPVVRAERNLIQQQSAMDENRSIVNGALEEVKRLCLLTCVAYDEDQSTDELQRTVASLVPAVRGAAQRALERQALQDKSTALQDQTNQTTASLGSLDERKTLQQAVKAEAALAVARAEAAVDKVSGLAEQLASSESAEKAGRSRDTALAERRQLIAGLELAKTQLAQLEADLTRESETHAALQESVDLLPQLATALTSSQERAKHAVRLTELDAQLAEAEKAYLFASEEQKTKARAFAFGVAPRLARQLIEGEPCLVCGSTDHPQPAEGEDDLIDQDQMNQAHQKLNQAFATLTSLRDAVDELTARVGEDTDVDHAKARAITAQTQLTEAQRARTQWAAAAKQLDTIKEANLELAGVTATIEAQIQAVSTGLTETLESLGENRDTPLADLAERARQHRAALLQCRKEADGLADARARVGDAENQLSLIAAHQTELAAKLSADEATIQSLSDQIQSITDSLAVWNDVDLTQREAGLEQLLTAIGALSDALDARSLGADRLQTAKDERSTVLTESQLHSVEEALAYELGAEEIQRLETLHEEFKARSLECDSQLRQLAELGVPDLAPDLEELAETARAAQVRVTEATGQRVSVQHLIDQSLNLVATSTERLDHIEFLTEIADRRTQVARLCDAKGASKIGLEGFILRSHLHDVVVQANIRLDNLSSGRYQMVLAEEALSAQGEWGLDLTIVDAHTGTERPVTTLSGGEIFYTSLSLALGLSDVLSNRGATAISSVFIDEGFGSLDDKAIDDTIDVLNQLRSDGVTIGVITHVGALREALPAGLSVQKLPSGGSRVIQAA